MISQKKLNQLKQYFATQPVDVIYLFGSQATKKATKLSDADLGVLFKEGLSHSKRFDLRLEYTAKTSGILGLERVDVVDLELAPLTLKYSSVSPRKEIYNRNDKRRAVFEAETTSRYFDQVYFIKQNTRNSLASIAQMKI